MTRLPVPATMLMALVVVAGCGTQAPTARPDRAAMAAVALDLSRTRPLGSGRAFRPVPVANRLVAVGAPTAGLRCLQAPGRPYGTHIELFARGHEVVVPAGIGIAPPQRVRDAVVTGRCLYPLRTVDPTGVVEIDPRAVDGVPTVGELFRIWGQPLSPRRLVGFAASRGHTVVAFVNGRRWPGDPRLIALTPHAQIVLELDASVAPHPSYAFPPGL